MAKANAQIEITASSSRLVAGLSAAYSKFQAFGGAVARGMGAAFKKINAKLEPGGTAKRAIGNFGGDMMGRGLDAVVDAAQGVRDFESDLQRLGVTTHKNPAQMEAVRRAMAATSAATAISRNELAKAAGVYFDLTSDADGMSSALDTFARTAQASGASMEDIVKASAAMKNNMGIGPAEMEAVFSGLIKQGEAGQIALKDMGAELPELTAMFSKFGKGKQGMLELGAAYQVGAKAFGSSSKSATGLVAMMGMLQARQKQLKSAGVDVFKVNKDGTVTMRNLSKIVDDIRSKKIDPRKMGAIFGENKEGRAFLDKLVEMPGLYRDIVAAGGEAGAVQEYALARAESKAGRLDIAINRMKESIAGAFTPERIEAFTRGVEELADRLGPIVGFVGKIADKLGALSGVGKSIRGALEGEANPFKEDNAGFMRRVSRQAGVFGGDNSPEAKAERLRRADEEFERAKLFRGARDTIMGAEVDERTTPESIRRAVLASYSGDTRTGAKGNDFATRLAGSQYLEAAGVTPEKQKEIYGKEFADALKASGVVDLLTQIAGKDPTKVQIGENQVARAADASTDPRRRTH